MTATDPAKETGAEVVLVEVVDAVGLERLSALVRDDPEGMAEFGGFYGRAVERLGPLLGSDRRAWLVVAEGREVGFIDAETQGGAVGLARFAIRARRRSKIARVAVEALIGLQPWPSADTYLAVTDRDNRPSRRLARPLGLRLEGLDPADRPT